MIAFGNVEIVKVLFDKRRKSTLSAPHLIIVKNKIKLAFQ